MRLAVAMAPAWKDGIWHQVQAYRFDLAPMGQSLLDASVLMIQSLTKCWWQTNCTERPYRSGKPPLA